jgi:hypothetical protein
MFITLPQAKNNKQKTTPLWFHCVLTPHSSCTENLSALSHRPCCPAAGEDYTLHSVYPGPPVRGADIINALFYFIIY